MQLEKVSTGSGQAALAGWISSNDVTLFTTVLVMAMAIFLHARYTKGAKENVDITREKAELAKRLATTASELGASRDLLEKRRGTLNLTQAERDQIQQQLVDKLSALARLNSKLDALLHEKGLLESKQRALAASKESLSKEKADLIARQAALSGDRDSLKTTNVNLREQLQLITSQLAGKIAALEQIEQERDRLKKQADELDKIVAGLKQKMQKLNIDLAEAQASTATAMTQSQSKMHELESRLAERDKTAEEYLGKLKRAAELFQGLTAEKKQLQRALSESERALSEAELKRQADLVEESRNNRELVGLSGRLERVAILFDASGSMRKAATSGGGDRWAEAQQIAETWLEHLNVQQCVLVVFASEVRTFPQDGTLADLRGADGKAKRDWLMQQVKAVRPGGGTNTLDALRTAYGYDVDSILLFSDGAPSVSGSGAFNPAAAQKIYALTREHPNIPIHTMGLGNYFDQNASTFLMSLAKLTNGSFRGR